VSGLDEFRRTYCENRYAIEVVTTSGRAAAVEFRFQFNSVEVWHAKHCGGVFDRDVLQAWLTTPREPLVVDEVAFSLDRMVDHDGRVALSLPDVMFWTLSPCALADLLQRIQRQPPVLWKFPNTAPTGSSS